MILTNNVESECVGEPLLVVNEIEGIHVIAPVQALDKNSAYALEMTFASLDDRAGPIVLDLDSYDHLASEPLLLISRWAARFKQDRRLFGVCSSQISIRLLLTGLRLTASCYVFPNLSSAIPAFRPGARQPLGEILLAEFGLSRKALYKALIRQMKEGGLLGHLLLVQGEIKPVDLALALARQNMS